MDLNILIFIFFILFLAHHKNKFKSNGLYTLKPTLNEMPKPKKKKKKNLFDYFNGLNQNDS